MSNSSEIGLAWETITGDTFCQLGFAIAFWSTPILSNTSMVEIPKQLGTMNLCIFCIMMSPKI
ncbi:MAG: hypothetical protein HC836_28345 [Richelia sp. RM2_1_2]|nr:hypothetical protein [Richelia sp. RM2_1_2]